MTDIFKDKQEALQTGYKRLDKFVSIERGTFNVVAGMTSHGKTALLMNLCNNMLSAYPDKRFYFITCEESQHEVALKMIAVNENSDSVDGLRERIIAGGDKYKNHSIIQALESYRLVIDTHCYPIDELGELLSKVNAKDVGAIFIDNLRTVPPTIEYGNYTMQIINITDSAKKLARQTDIPIITSIHIPKEGYDDFIPANEEYFYIQSQADTIISLTNRTIVWKQTGKAHGESPIMNLEIEITKNRNGDLPTKRIDYDFIGKTQRIEELPTNRRYKE